MTPQAKYIPVVLLPFTVLLFLQMNMFLHRQNDAASKGVASGTVHRLCGCDVCTTVSFDISKEKYGGSLTVTLNVIDPPVGHEEGWYDMVLLGENGVFASPISSDPTSGMTSIRVSKAGFYRVGLSPSHKNADQAMALTDNEQEGLPDNAPCHLLMEEPFPVGISERFTRYPRIEVTLPALKENEKSSDDIHSDGNDPFWVVDDSCDYELYFDPVNKVFPLCHHDRSDKPLVSSACHGDTSKASAILLGDSHAHCLTDVMRGYHPEVKGWYVHSVYHGTGIYFNLSSKNKFEEYIQGLVKAEFVEGKMLQSLRNGEYEALQKEHKFNIWFFGSGAWDLRDVSVSEYEDDLTELFDAFVKFRELFKDTDSPLRLVWLGVPSFSFNTNGWKGMQKHTNVKGCKAHLATAKKAKECDIKMLPFFDVTYPVFRQSCDSHHYICNKKVDYSKQLKEYNPIGHEFLKVVLDEGNVCIDK